MKYQNGIMRKTGLIHQFTITRNRLEIFRKLSGILRLTAFITMNSRGFNQLMRLELDRKWNPLR